MCSSKLISDLLSVACNLYPPQKITEVEECRWQLNSSNSIQNLDDSAICEDGFVCTADDLNKTIETDESKNLLRLTGLEGEVVLLVIDNNPVMFWPGYGVVCPYLWTTNGSFRYISKRISEAVKRGCVVSNIALQPGVNFGDEISVYNALRNAESRFYKNGNKSMDMITCREQ